MASNDQDSFQYDGQTGGQPQPPGTVLPPGSYKFTEEEIRTLNECNTESFFQRSLPLGTMLGLGTYAAVQRGTLKPNPRFGPYPKVTLAVVVGYFLGKLSYQRACAEKLMALPNSYIGQLLREKRDPVLGPRRMQPAPPMLGAKPDEIYSDAGPGSSLDLDVERPLFSDDAYRPSTTDSDGVSGPASPAPARPSASYDELRRQNRGEYANARQDPYKVETNTVPIVTRPRTAEPRTSTNKYGDIME
ncbi:OCIA domain-containing protein 1 isoform X2 [Epargyreus clarus]|uniref:OCIA domain-containing protein 1 isoform X2 n=1 Tax=Epargyreus clarus TaxID=520877 RepID=UPI003C2F81C4